MESIETKRADIHSFTNKERKNIRFCWGKEGIKLS